MAEITKTRSQATARVSEFRCEECQISFGYDLGFPNFCPECGVEFDELNNETLHEEVRQDDPDDGETK